VKDYGQLSIDAQTQQPAQSRFGPRRLFKSTDRGVTWSALTYDPAPGYRHAYSLDFDPVDSQTLYLGAFSGLYRSTDGGGSWAKLPAPATYTQATCRGAALTPDGQYVFAVFAERHAGDNDAAGTVTTRVLTTPWVARVGQWNWQQLAAPAAPNGLYFPGTINEYWRPLVDPRSGSAEHGLAGLYQVLLGCMVSTADIDQGLFLGTFSPAAAGDTLAGSWTHAFKRPFGTNRTVQGWDFDMGWNDIFPQCRQYVWTPPGWPDREIWLASQQSLYVGAMNAQNQVIRTSWDPRSTRAHRVIAGTTFYQNRGFASTVNQDQDAWESYVAQTMADNCVLESWDGGESWTQAFSPLSTGTGDAVHVLRPEGGFSDKAPYVLLSASQGAGGGSNASVGALRAKRIVTAPTSTAEMSGWTLIAGGPSPGLAGINENRDANNQPTGAGQRIYSIESHPTNRGRVFLGTLAGLFWIADIHPLIESGTGTFQKITSGSVMVNRVWPDPENQDRVHYFVPSGAARGLHLAVRGGGAWSTQPVITGANIGDATVWRHAGMEWIAYSVVDSGAAGAPLVFLSNNGGAGFQTVLTREQVLAIHAEPWWNVNGTSMTFSTVGLAGFSETLTVGTHVEFGKHGYAMLQAAVSGSPGAPQATWRDWTGMWPLPGYMEVPRLWRGKIVSWQGEMFYMAATRGGGLWWRQLTNPPLTYPDWAWQSGLPLLAPDSLPTADIDGDGWQNLLEYATGTDPLLDDSFPVMDAGIRAGHLELEISWNPAASGISWRVEASADLVDWKWDEAEILGGQNGVIKARDLMPAAGPPRRFLRFQVTQP
jgi:hypothetical protein